MTASDQANTHTHVPDTVPLTWGSLRPAPIIVWLCVWHDSMHVYGFIFLLLPLQPHYSLVGEFQDIMNFELWLHKTIMWAPINICITVEVP